MSLTAAGALSEARSQVRVLEADPELVGGISRIVQYKSPAADGKGFRFDIGGHRFFSKSRESRTSGPNCSATTCSCGPAVPGGKPQVVRRLGERPVRPAVVRHLLQDLCREGVGDELPGDLGRLGRAATQGPLALDGDLERPLPAPPAVPFRCQRKARLSVCESLATFLPGIFESQHEHGSGFCGISSRPDFPHVRSRPRWNSQDVASCRGGSSDPPRSP
jgi:hypothetical protein